MEEWSGKFKILSQDIQPSHPQISLCWFPMRPLAASRRGNWQQGYALRSSYQLYPCGAGKLRKNITAPQRVDDYYGQLSRQKTG